MAPAGRASRQRVFVGAAVLTAAFILLVTIRLKRQSGDDVMSSREIMNAIKNAVNYAVDNSFISTANDGKIAVKWDPNGRTYRLWKDSSSANCSQYQTRFALGLPRTYLVSFPGSGNTWTRYLLEAASGIFTGAVYNDKVLRQSGYLGEADAPDSGRTLVQKTHGKAFYRRRSTMKERYEVIRADLPCILIIRNPARALIAYWKFIQIHTRDRQIAQLDEKKFKTEEFHYYVKQATITWEQLISDRLLWSSAPIHVVYYEQLVQDPIFYVKEMLEFLRIPADENRLRCLENHLEGSFKRPHRNESDPYEPEEKAAMSYAVQRVRRLLNLLGYPEMPKYEELV